MRHASTRVARRSLVWRSRLEPVVQEKENAGHLDLLGSSCLVLARTAASLEPVERAKLASHVRELAEALAEVSDDLGNRAVRQSAADRGLAVAVDVSVDGEEPDSAFAAAVMSVRMAATDLMVFAGIDSDDAVAAVREELRTREVRSPPEPARPASAWRRRLRLPFSRRPR